MKMLKKFKTSKQVWINYGCFLMKNGKMEEARNLLARSVKSLSEKKCKNWFKKNHLGWKYPSSNSENTYIVIKISVLSVFQ